MQVHHHAYGAGIAAPETLHPDPDDLEPLGAVAAAPGVLSPVQSDKAPTGANARDFRNQGKSNSEDSALDRIAEQDRVFSTARAKLALTGWALHLVDIGNGAHAYLVSRWGQSRKLPDWHTVGQFMKQVGCE